MQDLMLLSSSQGTSHGEGFIMRKLIATAAMLLIFILTGLTVASSFGQAQEKREQRGKACQIPEPEPSPKPSPSPKPRHPKPQKP